MRFWLAVGFGAGLVVLFVWCAAKAEPLDSVYYRPNQLMEKTATEFTADVASIVREQLPWAKIGVDCDLTQFKDRMPGLAMVSWLSAEIADHRHGKDQIIAFEDCLWPPKLLWLEQGKLRVCVPYGIFGYYSIGDELYGKLHLDLKALGK